MSNIEMIATAAKNLGIDSGDSVLIRGNLGKLGKVKRDEILKGFLSAVGETGTIVTLGFSQAFPFYRVDKSFIFTKDTDSTSGALAKLFLAHGEVKRSRHPTNSFLAIGKNAEFIVAGHDENSLSYEPMRKLIELDAKMLIFGMIAESPGFTTVHYAQQLLGLTQRSFLKNYYQVYYEKDGAVKLFKRADLGGCSSGFDKFYKNYLDKGLLRCGQIGNATALSINSRDAFAVEHEVLQANPSYLLCDNPLCISCRLTWQYDLKYSLNCIALNVLTRLRNFTLKKSSNDKA